jgi:hypothetical protein
MHGVITLGAAWKNHRHAAIIIVVPCSWVQQQLRAVRLCGLFSHGMR